MFGFSFSELVVVILVAVVVMGPKELPRMLRRAGQLAGKLRRAAADLRAQSGIDDALRTEGLAGDIAEIRKLARGELDAVHQITRLEDFPTRPEPVEPPPQATYADTDVDRDREYPRDGADAYQSLPDTMVDYADANLPSPLARDALYALGDANAVFPAPPDPAPTLEGPVSDPSCHAEATS